jgi:PAS domain S-box-containing protein
MPKRVSAKLINTRSITPNVYELTFEPSEKIIFSEGQYVWIIINDLKYSDPKGTRRAFSIASPPGQTNIQILVKATSGGFNQSLCGLQIGQSIQLYGPFGSFLKSGIESQVDMIFIAGGVAVAPYLSVIRHVLGMKQNRNVYLIHSNKETRENLYSEELNTLSNQNKNFRYVPITSIIDQSKIAEANAALPAANWYVTGPQGFVNSVWVHLKNLKIPINNINFEENYPTTEEFSTIQIEDLKAESKSFFKLISDNAFLHIIVTDINGHIIYANQAAENITGFSFSEMQGQTPRLWGGFATSETYKEIWKTIKELRKSYNGKFKNVRKNGQSYVARATVSPIIDGSSKLIGFIGTEEDITHQEEAESETRRLAAIADSSPDAIYSKDPSGTIITWNIGAEKMYGYYAAEIIGENVSVVIPEKLRSEDSELTSRINNGEAILQHLTKRVRKDGVVIDVELSISPIKDEFGKVSTISVLARDVTKQKDIQDTTARMNKLMVGRELRMIELKTQIKQLTGQQPK